MKPVYTTALTLAIAAAGLVGCESEGSYKPAAQPTQLAAYAATVSYPKDQTPTLNPRIVAEVNSSTGDIVLRNFGNEPLKNFTLWVNQSYLLHVDMLDGNNRRMIGKELLYNSGGTNMADVEAKSITKVQYQDENGKLFDVEGPQIY